MSSLSARQIVISVARASALEGSALALEQAFELVQNVLPPHERLTVRALLIADSLGALARAFAVMITAGTGERINKLKESSAERDVLATSLLKEVSPELVLYCLLFAHFQETSDGQDAYASASRMLKTLGHTIPETLVPGLEEIVRA